MIWHPFRKRKQLSFAEDREMQTLQTEADEFYANILEDGDEPAFVSDEASVFDISSSTPEYLIDRCSAYYGVNVARADLRLSFHALLRKLQASRSTHAHRNNG